MATNKTTAERIAEQRAKMEQMENELKRLRHQQKEEERKARNHRICQRGGLLEKLLPETIAFTEEQIRAFFEKTLLTPFARRVISEVTAQGGEEPNETTVIADRKDGGNPAKPPLVGGAASAAKAPEAVTQGA